MVCAHGTMSNFSEPGEPVSLVECNRGGGVLVSCDKSTYIGATCFKVGSGVWLNGSQMASLASETLKAPLTLGLFSFHSMLLL